VELEEEEYLEYIFDRYKNPQNKGVINDADITHEEGNPSCGDVIRIYVKLSERDGVKYINEIKFDGRGCAISQASADILAEEVKGKTLDEAKAFGKDEMLEALGIPLSPVRLKCGLLALKVLKAGAWGIKEWPDEQ
jgi:nitrogen fixation NifU-like protein